MSVSKLKPKTVALKPTAIQTPLIHAINLTIKGDSLYKGEFITSNFYFFINK